MNHFVENVPNYKAICASVEEYNVDIIRNNELLFNVQWMTAVRNAVSAYGPVWELIEGSEQSNLSWAINYILKMTSPSPSMDYDFQVFLNTTLLPINLIAFILDPKNNERLLNDEHHDLILRNVYRVFPRSVVPAFLKYRRNEQSFSQGREELGAESYWETLKFGEYRELAEIALKLYSLPAASFNKNFLDVDYDEDSSLMEKIMTIIIDVS